MYLKSLTLRGFKSFASATTLAFEPGITCVVGPNGSGKSNVVDAIAWVMGEQGAKSLRGGKMEDVIFAGTSGRAPLGRAEVALTIDNSDGALPIDYTEVTITRTMFRNGGSEYQINGDTCRLLDVQELLSDSGIGREMHVIVGQGQLDAILHATPEERRGFIEEAAGVLKHRKRKEKALRKLDAMSANLVRLTDLTSELRRQLKPLGRQAELARRAQVIQADLRDARLRLLADDVVSLSTSLAQEEADEAALLARRDEVQEAVSAARSRETQLEDAIAADAPLQVQVQDTYVALTGLRERYAGLRSVAQERLRHAESTEQTEVGPDPDDLDRQAAGLRSEDAQLGEELARHAAALQAAEVARVQAQRALTDAEGQLAAARRAVADRREGLARLRGTLAAAVSRAETRSSEIERLEQAHADALLRAQEAERDFAEVEAGVGSLASGEEDLDAGHAAAQAVLDAAEQAVAEARDADAAAGRDEAALTARIEALAMGLERKDGTATVLAAAGELAGVLGSVAALVHVDHGYEVAVGAALGALADGAAVADADAAVAALEFVGGDEGRAHLLVAADDPLPEEWPQLDGDAVYAIDVIRTEPRLRAALARILRRVVVVADLPTARAVVAQHDVVAVTRQGDVLGRAIAAGGRVESLLEVQAAVDEARMDLDRVRAQRERLAAELAAVGARRDEARAAVDAALERLHESDARMAAVAEQLGALGSAARAAQEEAARLVTAVTKARAAANEDRYAVEQLQQRLAAAEAEPEAEEPSEDGLTRHKAALEASRAGEMDARLALRTTEERHRAVVRRAEELEAAAHRVRADRARLAEQRRRQQRAAEVAADVLAALDVVEPMVGEAAQRAQQERLTTDRVKAERDAQLRELRSELRTLAAEAARLNDSVHRDELAKTQQRLRIEAAQERALTEFGVDGQTLVAEYGPEQLIPASAVPAGDAEDAGPDEPEAQPIAYVRAEQEARAKRAERDLVALGRVNPLALEEFAALQERQAFLSEQLEDLKKGRDDLLGIIADVDERVREVFTEAYRDVEQQFEQVFGRLFPGGEGRLVLTDPDDMLTTGVEVEARPPGKRIKRLSLLSGGERSLTAVAFLVALFKARPSPFYLLDEVEAALDDVNLGRLLDLLEELRATSQLLVITHQKRSMEVADALYGVTMRDGVTSVISQRLREAV